MKKIAVLVTSVVLLLALVGCGTFSYNIRDYVTIPDDYATNLTIKQSDIDKQVADSKSSLLSNYKGKDEVTTGTVENGMTTYIYYAGTATVFNGLYSFKVGDNAFAGLDEALKAVEFKDGKATVELTLASDFKFPEEISKAMQDKADAAAVTETTTTPASETPTPTLTGTETPAEGPAEYNPSFIAPVNYDDETPAVDASPAQGETETATETAEPEDPYKTYNDFFAGKKVTVELTVDGKNGAVADGDNLAATMKITHVFDGGTYDESKGETGYELKIGSGAFIPGFEDGMIGMSVEKGTERDLELTFPSPYASNKVLSGMDVVFKVRIVSVYNIYERNLSVPSQFEALKADFEKANGAGSFDYKDEADYIAGLTKNVKASLASTELVNKSKVVKFKYSDLEDYENSVYATYANYYYSLTGSYPNYSTVLSSFFGGDEQQFVNMAGKQLKNDWVLYQVAKDQGLDEISSEEYDKYIAEQLASYNSGRSEENQISESELVKNMGGKTMVKKYITLDKAQKWLGEHVNVV